MSICHTSCLLKFGHETLNCPSIRYIVPANIFPVLPMCQKNWFCGKVGLDDFYLLLRSIAPLGSILVSKESPRTAVYTTCKIWFNFQTILNGILKIFKNALEDGFQKTKTETLKVSFERKKKSVIPWQKKNFVLQSCLLLPVRYQRMLVEQDQEKIWPKRINQRF